MTDRAALVAAHFTRTFGREPDGVWAAPGRVNLIGEHTDYNAGLVLPIALPQRTYAAVGRRDDRLVRVTSVEFGDRVVEVPLDGLAPHSPAHINGDPSATWVRYPAGVLWALEQAGHPVTGFDIAITSDVPVGAGLSSSAAIEGAVGAAASDLCGLGLLADDRGRAELAAICQRAENEIALAPTGGMDQAAALRSLPGHAMLLDCRSGEIDHVPFDVARAGLTLLVVDTRAPHQLVDGQYGERRASCERAAAELGVSTLREVEITHMSTALGELSSDVLVRRARHVITEIERTRQAAAALRAGDWTTLGRLWVDSHTSLRRDFEVSCPELDLVVDTALAHGALGARMTGGGFGGSAIALVARNQATAALSAIADAFAAHGFAPPAGFTAEAGRAAARES